MSILNGQNKEGDTKAISYNKRQGKSHGREHTTGACSQRKQIASLTDCRPLRIVCTFCLQVEAVDQRKNMLVQQIYISFLPYLSPN